MVVTIASCLSDIHNRTGAPGVRPTHVLSQSAGEFRWSRSTKVLRQTTPVAEPIPSPRRAFHVLSLAASRQSKASRDASSGTPFSTGQDLVDALPTCIDSVQIVLDRVFRQRNSETVEQL